MQNFPQTVRVLDMRRFDFVMLLLTAAITTVTTGCRQTTATTATSPLVPLAPNGAAAPPSLMPFGTGQVRVTPPPANSGTPNNYLGGAPNTQSNNAPFGASGFAAQAIGSGVPPTGWNAANGVNGAVPQGTAPTGGLALGVAPVNPRSGGMQVIDLTAAPAPPGYRPSGVAQTSYGSPSISQPNYNAPGLGPQPTFQPAPVQIQTPPAGQIASGFQNAPSGVIAQAPQPQAQPQFQAQPQPQFQSAPQPQFQSAPQPQFQSVPQPQFQSAPQPQVQGQPQLQMAPVPTSAQFQPIQRNVGSLPPNGAPSTEPVQPQPTTAAPQNDLRWRTPGTQF